MIPSRSPSPSDSSLLNLFGFTINQLSIVG